MIWFIIIKQNYPAVIHKNGDWNGSEFNENAMESLCHKWAQFELLWGSPVYTSIFRKQNRSSSNDRPLLFFGRIVICKIWLLGSYSVKWVFFTIQVLVQVIIECRVVINNAINNFKRKARTSSAIQTEFYGE